MWDSFAVETFLEEGVVDSSKTYICRDSGVDRGLLSILTNMNA